MRTAAKVLAIIQTAMAGLLVFGLIILAIYVRGEEFANIIRKDEPTRADTLLTIINIYSIMLVIFAIVGLIVSIVAINKISKAKSKKEVIAIGVCQIIFANAICGIITLCIPSSQFENN